MRRRVTCVIYAGIMSCILLLGFSTDVHAKNYATNPDTGFEVIIEDEAELLSEAEELSLAQKMAEVTAYGHAAFVSVDSNYTSAGSYAEDCYYSFFGYESGTLFLIDMDNREIYIYSDGDVYKTITKSYANTITDNIYTYASDAEYFACAYKAFEQIVTLLKGNRIAQPMKYASNAFLAVLVALLINYFVVKVTSAAGKPGERELLEATKHRCSFTNTDVVFTHTTKKYDPPSSSSSGGGGRSGGGGGGGGGGHSF